MQAKLHKTIHSGPQSPCALKFLFDLASGIRLIFQASIFRLNSSHRENPFQLDMSALKIHQCSEDFKKVNLNLLLGIERTLFESDKIGNCCPLTSQRFVNLKHISKKFSNEVNKGQPGPALCLVFPSWTRTDICLAGLVRLYLFPGRQKLLETSEQAIWGYTNGNLRRDKHI